jgi:hypothetical protein
MRPIWPAALAALALAAASAGVLAQKAYRYVYPDGRIVYSDRPVPGARLQGEVAPPPPPAAPPPGATELPGARRPDADDAAAARSRRLAQADDEVRAAEAALNDARLRLAAGREPLPGERTGTAGGGSRLNEAYEARQAANERAVADAQARLDRAIAARDAVR